MANAQTFLPTGESSPREGSPVESSLMPYAINRFVELTPHAVALWRRMDRLWALGQEVRSLPTVTIDLMLDQARHNDPFYGQITRAFYRQAKRPHPKFPLVDRMRYGLAVCRLQGVDKPYIDRLDSAARRNIKKALRLGYTFGPLDFNAHLADVRHIHQSTRYRQGREVHEELLHNVRPHANPRPRDHHHGFPYFGVFKDGRLVAYAGCLVAGELCQIQTIYGHAQFQSDGIVPLLITRISEHLQAHHPSVRYYAYGTYFGATPTMQRFKRKFLFEPCCVKWRLGE